MPPLPPVPGVIKCEFAGSDSGGSPWANIVHYSYGGGIPSADTLSEIVGSLVIGWTADMKSLQATNLTLDTIKMTDLSSAMGAEYEGTVALAGTRIGSFLPASACLLISYPGAGPRYRGGHPRTYLNVGVQADLADEAHWGASFVEEAEPKWQNAVTYPVGTTFGTTTITSQCAVYYYTTDYTTIPHTRIRKAVPGVYTINDYVAQPQLASQRSRIGRRRR